MKTFATPILAAFLLSCAALPPVDLKEIHYTQLPANISRALGSPEVIQRLDAIRARGLPVTLKELGTWFTPVPAAENAAEILWPILSQLNTNSLALKLSDDDRQFLKKVLEPEWKYKPLPAEMAAPLSELLKRYNSQMVALRDGSRRPHCRFPIDLSLGAATLLPHLSNYRTACNLFAIEGLQFADKGEMESAVQNFETLTRFVLTLRDEPLLISVLVQYACHNVITSHAERLLALHLFKFNWQQLARMQAAIAQLHNPTALRRAFTTERAMAIDYFTIKPEAWLRFADSGTNSTPKSALAQARKIVSRPEAAIRTELLFLFDFYDQCELAGSKPYQEQIQAMKPAFAALQAKDAETRYPISVVMLPVLNKILARAASNKAQLRCAETGLAIARYRLVNEGQFPKQLSDLSPRFLPIIPQDPFDNQPLKYRVEEGKVARVHSVGPNLKEDDLAAKIDSPEKDDILFFIGRRD
ncbi:MAG: hypothetical protein EXS24_05215 [Pedosphaera sp.]|nr:hypothetical protein [Pedosphaera sp.]